LPTQPAVGPFPGILRGGGRLKLIGAGLPRTGTTSVRAALERLGLRCYGAPEAVREPGHLEAWTQLVAGGEAAAREMDWHGLLRGHDATLDAPACFHWSVLARAFPDAKVLLTVRDGEAWRRSVAHLLTAASAARPAAALMPRLRRALTLADALLEGFVGPDPTSEAWLAAQARHDAQVVRGIPAERLLIFRVDQGWGPLCDFLGCEVPACEPFPKRVESGHDWRRRLRALFGRAASGPEGHAR